jgi:O-antigen ligase
MYMLDRIAPCLFGLMVYASVRHHSSSWLATLPDMVGIMVAVGGALFLLTRAHERLSVPRSIRMPLLLLAVSVAISTFSSAGLAESLLRLLLYMSVALLAIGVYLLYRDAGRIPLVPYCLVIAVVHAPFVVEVILELIEADGRLFPDGLNVANFANVRHFGHVCYLAAMGGSALVALSRRLDAVSFGLTSCALFGIIAMGSRGPLLAWAFFVGLLFCFSPARWRIAAYGLAALVATSALVWYLHDSGLLITPNIFVRLEQALQTAGAEIDSGRLAIWRDSVREIVAHPLFGQGPEGYSLSDCCNTGVTHPHNFVLQLLMEFGFVGCSIALWLAVRAVSILGAARGFLKVVMASPTNRVLTSALVAYLALGLIDGMLYFVVPLMHFALFCGLLAAGIHHAGVITRSRPQP